MIVLGRKPGGAGGGGAPSGPAGGDLSGTYPNPSIANGVVTEAMMDSGAAAAGEVLTADGAGGASYAGLAMVMIADDLLAGVQASFDFQNIPATYKHLLIELQGRTNDAGVSGVGVELRFNNDSSAIYGSHYIQVNNVTSAGGSNANGSDTAMDIGLVAGATAPAGRAGSTTIIIPNYAGTTWHKDVESKGSILGADAIGASWFTRSFHGIWRSTAAISRVTLFSSPGGSFIAGSRATLYGLD